MSHQLLVCSDIFGHTESLALWCQDILPEDWQLKIVSPYISSVNFSEEALAYSAFQRAGGIERYATRIAAALLDNRQRKIVIGLSAGAASVYKVLSEKDYSASIDGFYGFYPGQIRFFTQLQPSVLSTLYFPHKEPNFTIDTVIEQLSKHDNVNCHKTSFEHGFMNSFSRGYDEEAMQEYSAQLTQSLSKIS